VKKEICDNCDCKKELAVIRYLTKRNATRLVLCRECFDKFKLMINGMAGDSWVFV